MKANVEKSTAKKESPKGQSKNNIVQWVEEHGDYLFRYAVLRTKDQELAEELVQETFLAAVKGQDSFLGNSSVRTWLVGILKHKLIDHYRKASRENVLSYDINDDSTINRYFSKDGHWADEFNPGAWQDDPSQVVEQKEFFSTLDQCLTKLPERLRHVFSLRELEDLSTEEICKVLDITPTNLWVILHRARVSLRDCLEMNWIKPKGLEETN